MTCADPTLDNPTVENWAALDHILLATPLSESFTYGGSVFQQMVNSRHVPIYGVLSCRYPERPPVDKTDKLDYSCTQSF